VTMPLALRIKDWATRKSMMRLMRRDRRPLGGGGVVYVELVGLEWW
jgi:hypothetical protein